MCWDRTDAIGRDTAWRKEVLHSSGVKGLEEGTNKRACIPEYCNFFEVLVIKWASRLVLTTLTRKLWCVVLLSATLTFSY